MGGCHFYASDINVTGGTYTFKVGRGGKGKQQEVSADSGHPSEAFDAIANGGTNGGKVLYGSGGTTDFEKSVFTFSSYNGGNGGTGARYNMSSPNSLSGQDGHLIDIVGPYYWGGGGSCESNGGTGIVIIRYRIRKGNL